MKIDPRDIDWHDGNLVDVQVSGLMGKRQELALLLDLYIDDSPDDSRRRCRCIGVDLKRILFHGDMSRLIKNSKAGNVDFMRIEATATSEILTISLFGGAIEAEATSFHLTEIKP
jgi:hypothetical protein